MIWCRLLKNSTDFDFGRAQVSRRSKVCGSARFSREHQLFGRARVHSRRKMLKKPGLQPLSLRRGLLVRSGSWFRQEFVFVNDRGTRALTFVAAIVHAHPFAFAPYPNAFGQSDFR